MQLKNIFKKGRHIFAAYREEATKDRVASIEDQLVLRDFENVFGKIPRFPPKRDIGFSIDLVPRDTPVSKTPYIIFKPKLKELQM
jgi:hypothetical protein